MVDEIKRALEVAETIPFRYLVQHIGVGGENTTNARWKRRSTALEELSSLRAPARRRDPAREHSQRISSAERLVDFLGTSRI
jgi:hypothetical protein